MLKRTILRRKQIISLKAEYILKHLVTICKDAFKIWGQEGVVWVPEALILNCLPASCVVPNSLDQVSSVFALPSDLGLEVGGVTRGPAGLDLVRVVQGGWVGAWGDVGTGRPIPCPCAVCLRSWKFLRFSCAGFWNGMYTWQVTSWVVRSKLSMRRFQRLPASHWYLAIEPMGVGCWKW